ncbi:MAG: undecaprenyl diphosphate synthase family protein [Candidatus Pacebacteria bacterium]|nr:undecaprenyl diphosphate synthase family protein [Candidatus Paceibacterota bacterium]
MRDSLSFFGKFGNKENDFGAVLINVPKILLTFWYLFELFQDSRPIVLTIIIFLIVAYDLADGKFVNWKRSWLRRLSDNLTDKIVVNVIAMTTIWHFGMPTIWWLPFLAKDFLLLAGGFSLLRRGLVIFPNSFHRLALSFVAIFGMSILWYRGNFLPLFWGLTVVLTYASLIDFAGIFIKLKSIKGMDRYSPRLFEGIACLLAMFAAFSQVVFADQSNRQLPKHIAIICDGNRRYAVKQAISSEQAYLRGAGAGLNVALNCQKLGIEYLTAYVLSDENLQRDAGEIDAIKRAANYFLAECGRLGIKAGLVGPDSLMAPDFGGNSLLKVTLASGSFTSLNGLPDVDLIIRTGGRHRLSGFVNGKIGYAEINFSKTLWPEFSSIDFKRALSWYSKQLRTFGI